MIYWKLRLMKRGGRGSSSGASGGSSGSSGGSDGGARGGESFRNISDFENSLTGITDPNYGAYEHAYSEEVARAQEIRNVENQVRETGEKLPNWTRQSLESERADCQSQLDSMPASRTASEWGRSQGLEERISAIDHVLNADYSGGGNNPNDTEIII